MISLLFPLLLLHAVPDGYRDEIARDELSVTLSFVPSEHYRQAVPAITGEIPRTLYLLSLPRWRSFENEETEVPGTQIAADRSDESAPPLLLQQYQTYFDRLLAGKVVAKVIKRPQKSGPLACQIGATTLWYRAFTSWRPEATINEGNALVCSQVMALATLFSHGDKLPDEHLNVDISDDASASNFFSVLNLTIPTNSAPPPNWRPLANQRAVSAVDNIPDGEFIFPLTHEIVVTSPYGMRYHPVIHQFMRHEGVDLRAPVNSPVMTIADGDVAEAGYGPVTGFYVTVNHTDGWSSRYLHLNAINVHKGDKVLRGNVIGLSGATGRTNGPHLHLEISHHQQLSNPMEILSAATLTPNARRAQNAAVLSEKKPVVTEPVDMTPAIALISGEGEALQIGVRVGKTMRFYVPGEPVETADGIWRIVKRYGKYKLVKQPSAAKPE